MVTVNPQAFYDAAKQLSDHANDLATARTELTTALAVTGSMAGSTDSAKQWATGYDTRASTAADTASRLVHSSNHLSYLIAIAGHNHALANYNADTNPNKGKAPDKPSDPAYNATVVNWVHPPAAGGPGQGLETSIPNLLESIGVPVPDGNTDKLKTAADAWHKYANSDAVSHAQLIISSAMAKINEIDSPEVVDIIDQLDTLRSSAGDVETATYNLEVDCHNHKYKLDEMRKEIRDAVREVIVMIDESLALDILACLVTAGVGAIAGLVLTANVLKKIKDTGAAIKAFITGKKFEEEATQIVNAENTVERTAAKLEEIDALEAKTIEEEVGGNSSARDSTLPKKDVSFDDPKRTQLGSDGKYHIQEGNSEVQIDQPDNLSRTITDIDRVKDGVLWEEKSATDAGNVSKWVDKQVDKKLESYIDARQYINGYEDAPIGLRFTTPGADPSFKTAVENAVADLRSKHPGVTILVQWAQ
ncbi:MAG: hypothetical protein JWN03_7146 [Nocardia sp.]|uniref:hypothetical protein n=1 Tax=Nocardia sp. TaxID=1821 RepID=UPI002631B401|nr:hypothetical protein [Nocardia sp.]MCU1646871.1 hypothetical protein [Nocardia sp.]